MSVTVYEPQPFNTLERNILWMAVAGQRPFDMANQLSVPLPEIEAALSSIRTKTGETDVWVYALKAAQTGKLPLF